MFLKVVKSRVKLQGTMSSIFNKKFMNIETKRIFLLLIKAYYKFHHYHLYLSDYLSIQMHLPTIYLPLLGIIYNSGVNVDNW
jgi:hypothetical protein